jgi:hypothetical protein
MVQFMLSSLPLYTFTCVLFIFGAFFLVRSHVCRAWFLLWLVPRRRYRFCTNASQADKNTTKSVDDVVVAAYD